jgi:hypothetical protein
MERTGSAVAGGIIVFLVETDTSKTPKIKLLLRIQTKPYVQLDAS